jgi:tetratricopeptide (TPR) repeat protein
LTADSIKLLDRLTIRNAYDLGARSWALYWLHRYREAQVYSDTALDQAPREPQLWLLRAYVYRALAERDSSTEALQKTLSLSPNDTHALAALGLTVAESAVAQEDSGHTELALSTWKSALSYYEQARSRMRSHATQMWRALDNWRSWAIASINNLDAQVEERRAARVLLLILVAVSVVGMSLLVCALVALARSRRPKPGAPRATHVRRLP